MTDPELDKLRADLAKQMLEDAESPDNTTCHLDRGKFLAEAAERLRNKIGKD